ncbi:hypothetical protein H1S01_10700 [Heliobacterium chlorum]|uniref:Uncharacterized protein n=1 Tax=Heliobacterium chlorum TaxID=2698 RepID=A0ABR7T452_HELCL|nr:hypothetical protein [Heliobacterium chlorum]MBC9784977.1 hypothetical protein [Heliobacterium chlorum]
MKEQLDFDDDEDKRVSNITKIRKVILYWLLGIIYTAFIGLQLGRIQSIADYNYTLHEMFYIPANLAIYFVPILFLIYIYLVIISSRRHPREKLSSITKLKTGLVVTSIIAISLTVVYQFNESLLSGIFEIKEKSQDGSSYYLVIEDKKILVSKNEYNLIKVNTNYLITYLWNSFSPDTGKLLSIEPDSPQYFSNEDNVPSVD